MPPDAFAKELDRLWEQLRPLYLSLHAYVRGQLAKKYGKDVIPGNGPIPPHLPRDCREDARGRAHFPEPHPCHIFWPAGPARKHEAKDRVGEADPKRGKVPAPNP